MRKALLILFFSPGLLIAQGTSTGFSFLRVPPTARSAALAESDLADARPPASWISNPAMLAESKTLSVSLSHVQWIQDVQTQFFSGVFPFSFASFGLSISSTVIQDIEIRDRPGPPLGTFNARGTSFGAFFGIPLDDGLTFGAGLKYLFEKIYIDESIGFGLDLALRAVTPIEGLSAGLTLTNLGSANRMRSQTSGLPATFRLGAAYDFAAGELAVAAMTSYSHLLKGDEKHLHLGLEGRYDIVSLRTGYQTGYDSRGWSLGLGATQGMVVFDYAFLPFSFGLGSAHMATLTLQF